MINYLNLFIPYIKINRKNLTVDKNAISFELSDHKIVVSLTESGSKILPQANLEYIKFFELDDDGIGIRWVLLDEDLSISGLLRAAGREDLAVSEIPSLYLPEKEEEQLIKQAVTTLFKNLGPVETYRFLSMPSKKRMDSVERHRLWQDGLDKEIFFNEIFGK